MSQRLLIRLQTSGRHTWLAPGASAATAGLPTAQALARAQQVIVLVPATEVVLLEAPAVSRNRAQLMKAVPYALEDQLAQPVEELHFALAARVDGPTVGVAAVARRRLKSWLEELAAAGVHPDVLFPESLALPLGHLLIESGNAQLRLGPWRAAAMEPDLLAEWLEFADDGNLPEIEVFDTRFQPPQALPLAPRAYHERQGDALVLLARGLDTELPLNLLQGEYAPRHRSAPAARWWRLAALAGAGVLLLAFAQLLLERQVLAGESARLEAAMRNVLVQSFPEMEKVAGDPPALMKSALARLGGGESSGGLLRTLGQIAPVLGSTTRLTTRGMEFRNGVLELAVTAPDVPTLDSLRERLATLPGLKVELTAANPGQNGVDGRMRLSGATP
ncbi:type II secretion system protein GspL [Tahibacter harae]|uniref:Type II secretion system protein L n=1 Tax=Tahibacter harae TaxID=2963937 RepID=A0ABT1QSF6_9GAMM|nr:type II secretion system protein GspL [Tahibacter harae]MCQ4165192.1 type II secretion system protein GspL [Tahibacter harae]